MHEAQGINGNGGGVLMDYIYPAVFRANNDGSYKITYPDLPGCISEGKSLANAMAMAQSALKQWIGYLNDGNQEIPQASDIYAKKMKNEVDWRYDSKINQRRSIVSIAR